MAQPRDSLRRGRRCRTAAPKRYTQQRQRPLWLPQPRQIVVIMALGWEGLQRTALRAIEHAAWSSSEICLTDLMACPVITTMMHPIWLGPQPSMDVLACVCFYIHDN